MGKGRNESTNKYPVNLSILSPVSPKLNIKCDVILLLFIRSVSEIKTRMQQVRD